MKTCPKCRAANADRDDICRNCGELIAVFPAERETSPPTITDDAPQTASPSMEITTQPVQLHAGAPEEAQLLEAQPLPPEPVPTPKWLRVFGIVSILLGIGTPIANYFGVLNGIEKFEKAGFSDNVTLPLWINIWMFAAVGAYLTISGIGLLGPTLWGRRLSMLFVGLAVASAVIALVDGAVTKALAEIEFQDKHRNSFGFYSFEIRYFYAVPLFSPPYAILMTVMMLIPPVRDWACGTRAVQRGLPPEEAWATPANAAPPVHTPALMSMIISMIPFMLITQIVALIVGIVALRKINRSGGKLSGKGYAWAGIIISSLILTCIGSLIGLAVVGAIVADNKSLDSRSQPGYYYDDRKSDFDRAPERDDRAKKANHEW